MFNRCMRSGSIVQKRSCEARVTDSGEKNVIPISRTIAPQSLRCAIVMTTVCSPTQQRDAPSTVKDLPAANPASENARRLKSQSIWTVL